MGNGVVLKCKKCRYKLDAALGSGFLYPIVCEDLLQKIKQGKYGEEMMQAANSTPNVAIHQENAIYVCDDCGNLRLDSVVELCAPTEQYTKREGRYSTVIDFPGIASYVMDYEIGYRYEVLMSIEHKCEHCGNDMRAIKLAQIDKANIKCPKCNRELVIVDYYDWD